MSDDSEPATAAQIADVARTHARLLYRVAFGIVHNAQVAEDVCQDSLVKLIGQPPREYRWQQVRAWLVTTVTHGALEHLRRTKSEKSALQNRPPVQRAGDGPDDFLLREKLMDKVGQLEAGISEVVVLRIMQGLSGREVQDLLGLSAAEVSRRLNGGLERLRRAMHE